MTTSQNSLISGSDKYLMLHTIPEEIRVNLLVGSDQFTALEFWLLSIRYSGSRDRIKAIVSSMRSLDSLARHIDQKIDNEINSTADFSQAIPPNLNMLVMRCIEPVLDELDDPDHFMNFQETMIQKSIIYNTVDRHRIYNLKGRNINRQSTLDYLRPLLSIVSSDLEEKIYLDYSFLLAAEAIQIIDDLNDLENDLKNKIKTPVTEEFSSYKKLYKEDYEHDAYNSVLRLAGTRLMFLCRLATVSQNSSRYITTNNEIWRDFNFLFRLIEAEIIEHVDTKFDQRYWQQIIERVPPIFCYG